MELFLIISGIVMLSVILCTMAEKDESPIIYCSKEVIDGVNNMHTSAKDEIVNKADIDMSMLVDARFVPHYDTIMKTLDSIIMDEMLDWELFILSTKKSGRIPDRDIDERVLKTTKDISIHISVNFRNQLLFYYSMETVTYIIHSRVKRSAYSTVSRVHSMR